MSVYAENLLRELVALGHDVTLVSQYRSDEAGTRVYGGGPPPADRVPAGVRVVALASEGETVQPADFERDVLELAGTVERLHAERPFDVLHAQYGYPPGLAVLLASKATGLPTVVSVQGGDGHWVGTCCTTHKATITTVLDRAGAVLIGSPSFRDEVVGHHGTDPALFRIVPGATDTARFTPGDRPLGALQDPPVLLFHGRVDRRKGVLDLLEALPDGVRLVVSGVGPDLDDARDRADGRTTFLGCTPPDAAPEVYRSADVFVSPTYSDLVWRDVADALAPYDPDLWLAPQGRGAHVDHLQVVRAVASLDRPTLWWRDAPYVLRRPDARPSADLPTGLEEVVLPGDRSRRADACACYVTQLGFQFGGEAAMRAALADLGEPLLADARAAALV